MSSIDPSELFLAFARSHGGKLFGLAADSVKHVTSIIAANFSNYFEESIRSCIDVHTIFDRSRPLDLRRIYTPVHLAHAEHTQRPKVSDKRFRSTVISLPDYNRIRTFLVIGSAGTGKTMLLKHMFINMIENTAAKIPFYIPLRRYNSFDPAAGMPRFLHKVITNFRAQIDYTVFETEMTNGGFIFLLDGLDEVNPEKRRDVVSQILGLQPRYPKITLVVSSRPDESLALWPLSWPYHILPMEKSEIVSLIRKIPYRTDFKTRFINDLNDGLYEQHESFLSNPLLASIMMLTYSDIGRIPDRMHLFYEQAFETLFYRHDTWKEAGFYRHHYCDIPINRFLDCLSSFCIATYKKTCHEFTKSLALEFIKKAADFEKLNINEEDFLTTCLKQCVFCKWTDCIIGLRIGRFRNISQQFLSREICRI